MPKRFVRARPNHHRLTELRERLDSGEIESMETREAVWIEEDYCSPPLAMERAEVLDDYFEELTIVEEDVDETAGWQRINELPGLWNQVLGESDV